MIKNYIFFNQSLNHENEGTVNKHITNKIINVSTYKVFYLLNYQKNTSLSHCKTFEITIHNNK